MPESIKKYLIIISAVFGLGGSIATSELRMPSPIPTLSSSTLDYHLSPGQKMTVTLTHRIDDRSENTVCDPSQSGAVPGFLATAFLYSPTNDSEQEETNTTEPAQQIPPDNTLPGDSSEAATEASNLKWTSFHHPTEESSGMVGNSSEIEDNCAQREWIDYGCPIWAEAHWNSLLEMSLYRNCIYTHRYVVENISEEIQIGELHLHSMLDVYNYDNEGKHLFPVGQYFMNAEIGNYFY